MHKCKFTSTRFTLKMAAVAAPTLLPLAALASPAQGRGSGEVSVQRAVVTTITTSAANPGVSILVPVVGKVTLSDGKPAANAQLYITWQQNDGQQHFHPCTADANGKFETTITPTGNGGRVITSPLVVTALLPGKGMAWTQVAPSHPDAAKLRLSLMPLTTLEGRLVHADGTPNANTEVCVESLLPRALIRNGVSPAPDAAPPAKGNAILRVAVMQQNNSFAMLPLLPPEALAAQFHATTDANGKFTLNGVPRETTLALKPGGKLAMAAGSANMFAVQNRERQSAGVFVATPTVRVKVRVFDPQTHQPVPQMHVMLASANTLQNQAMMHVARNMNFNRFVTNANGEMTASDLLPGEYVVNVLGCIKTVRLEAGQDAPPVDIAVRHGLLKGRLLDADGKPVANADVRLATAGNNNGRVFALRSNDNNTVHQFIISPESSFPAIRDGAIATPDFISALPSMMTRTGPDGTFTIPNMPWGSPHVRVWATKGNDLAEWSGPAGKADANLTLQLRRNELMTVSGRLVDPDRRPLANVTCKALHWLASPRSTWFATAHDVITDADGNFKVDGMERGESFSLITVGQQQGNHIPFVDTSGSTMPVSLARNGGVENALQTLGGARTLTQQIIPIRQDFESPRFLTCATGDGQSLGEVMVHPQDTPDEVLQSYEGSPGDQPTLPGVVTATTPGDVQAAQAVLARFDNALKTGDVDALTALTSRVSPGWSGNRQEFLQNVSLCGRLNMDDATPTTRALNFVPRSIVAGLLRMAPKEAGMERAERIGEATDAAAEWVFLNRQMGDSVVLAGILHREAGEWRVVANHSFATPEALQMMDRNGGLEAGKWKQPATTLTPELQSEARQAGERYLQAWMGADREQMRRLTSPLAALPTDNLARFRHALERRADDGVCPLASEEKLALQPVANLTLWEQDWLKHLNGVNAPMNVDRLSVMSNGRGETVIFTQPTVPLASEIKSAPEKLAPGSDTAVFRYSAQGRDFLMILTRTNQHWQMLEPAMPL